MDRGYKPEKTGGSKTLLLPLTNKNKIYNLICELDSVFIRSVKMRPEFDGLVDKIADKAVVVAAYLNGEVAGYCAFYMNDFISNTAYITLIAVKEEYQNMCIGTALIEYVKQAAAVNGICKIRLEVDKENVKGIRFYERHQFMVEGNASDISSYMVCLL